MHRGSVHEAVEAREYPTLSRMRTWNSMFIQGFYISKTICSTIISITCTFYTLLSFNHLPVSLGCNEERKTARAVPRQPSSSNITSMTSTELLKLCASIPLRTGAGPEIRFLGENIDYGFYTFSDSSIIPL